MVYLFLGQDNLSKDLQLKKIRQESLAKETEQFNLDILYASDLSLKVLQERFLSLPFKNQSRLIVIKSAQNLKDDIKEYLINYVKSPFKELTLVLDMDSIEKKDDFLGRIQRYAKTLRFKENIKVDTFSLCRSIQSRKPDYALRILNQLLKEGERPERILGGLRYAWEREVLPPLEIKRRLKSLLNCDIEIKTGKLKPAFALEKLVVNLCATGASH